MSTQPQEELLKGHDPWLVTSPTPTRIIVNEKWFPKGNDPTSDVGLHCFWTLRFFKSHAPLKKWRGARQSWKNRTKLPCDASLEHIKGDWQSCEKGTANRIRNIDLKWCTFSLLLLAAVAREINLLWWLDAAVLRCEKIFGVNVALITFFTRTPPLPIKIFSFA